VAPTSQEIIDNAYLSGDVRIFGDDYELSALSREELEAFNEQFDSYYANPKSVLGMFVRERKMACIVGLRMAKTKIGGIFKGIRASGSELGWSYIRPGHIMRTAVAGTPRNVWDFAYTRNGTTDAKKAWIGEDTSYAQPITIDKHGLLVVLGLAAFDPEPTIDSIEISHGPTVYTPEVVEYGLQLADTMENIPIAPIHTRFFSPTNTLQVKTRNRRTGTQKIAVVGLTFGKGDWLSTDYYTSVST